VPAYRYFAKNRAGKRVSGIVQAGSRDDAVAKLTAVGLYPFNVIEAAGPAEPEGAGPDFFPLTPEAQGGEADAGTYSDEQPYIPPDVTRQAPVSFAASLFSFVSLHELALFCREMGAMLRAGLGLEGALSTILTSRISPYLRRAVGDMARHVYAGGALSEAMARYPRIFNRMFLGMVRSGEMTGNLDMIFAQLATFYEEEHVNKYAARTAFVIPAITLFMAFVAPFILAYLGWPGMRRLAWIVGLIYAGVLVFFILNKTRFVTSIIRFFLEYTPFVGAIMRKKALARLSFALGTMIRAGVPYLEALEISRDAAWLPSIERAVDELYRGVRSGTSIQEAMQLSRRFPPMVRNLVAVGERAGTVDEMFLKIAEYYNTETKYQSQALIRLIMPILTIIVGIIVAIILINFYGNYVNFITEQVGGD